MPRATLGTIHLVRTHKNRDFLPPPLPLVRTRTQLLNPSLSAYVRYPFFPPPPSAQDCYRFSIEFLHIKKHWPYHWYFKMFSRFYKGMIIDLEEDIHDFTMKHLIYLLLIPLNLSKKDFHMRTYASLWPHPLPLVRFRTHWHDPSPFPSCVRTKWMVP